MVFPLSYTLNDAEEILPPGTYRLDLVDAEGKFLEITVPINVGLRNAEPDDDVAAPEVATNENVSASLPVTGSDVRLVLEANVRSTQLAFQHHERTLTASLRMAETLRDGVQVLADANADILKSFASARGFLRNAAAPQQLALPPPKASESDDDDDVDEDEAPPQDDRLMAFGLAAMTLVNNLMETFKGAKTTAEAPGTHGQEKPAFDFMKYLDWRRAAPKPSVEPARAMQPKIDANEPIPPAELLRLAKAMPPEMHGKLAAVRSQFAPHEEKQLLWMIAAIDPAELPQILAEMATTSVDELVTLFRAQLAKPVAA